MRSLIALLLSVSALPAAEKMTAPQLIQMGRRPNATFREALLASLPQADIRKGAAVIGEGPDFLWAVESEKAPELFVDDRPGARMSRINGSSLWFATGRLETGRAHWFHYMINGTRFGGKNDVAAYGPDSYDHPGVPRGKLSEKLVHTSRLYEGMKSDYWIYVPALYNPSQPAAVMVWQDGHNLIDREKWRAQIVFDNLTYQKKIPVMIHVFLDPGKVGEKAMRSIEYDTVTDKYARFLLEEVLPEVAQKYNLRKDGYSRAISGLSSGGICSFNAAWWKPEEFSRVLSWIGSFTSIQWH
ncbi:MAG TPA: alpha/beta hydrolase-fold protein, partial [Bryobacteraceae bacterium]|nr:alpha/beta hydrolase-fold protein [Bryobacteraceae bacterium]